MRITAGVGALALAAGLCMGSVSPANARKAPVVEISTKTTVITAGAKVKLTGTTAEAATLPEGTTASLLALVNGGLWTPVAEDTTPETLAFKGLVPAETTAYKVVLSQAGVPSGIESSVVTVGVRRKITYPKSGFAFKGKVTPDYAKKKIVIKASTSSTGGFKKVAVIKTDAKGRYKYTIPRRGGTWHWQFLVKADTRFMSTTISIETNV